MFYICSQKCVMLTSKQYVVAIVRGAVGFLLVDQYSVLSGEDGQGNDARVDVQVLIFQQVSRQFEVSVSVESNAVVQFQG